MAEAMELRNRSVHQDEYLIPPDHSEDDSKKPRLKVSDVSPAAWILSIFSLIFSLGFLYFVVFPIVAGNTTPFQMILGIGHIAEGENFEFNDS